MLNFFCYCDWLNCSEARREESGNVTVRSKTRRIFCNRRKRYDVVDDDDDDVVVVVVAAAAAAAAAVE
jgi:hypothetical protein